MSSDELREIAKSKGLTFRWSNGRMLFWNERTQKGADFLPPLNWTKLSVSIYEPVFAVLASPK